MVSSVGVIFLENQEGSSRFFDADLWLACGAENPLSEQADTFARLDKAHMTLSSGLKNPWPIGCRHCRVLSATQRY